MSARLTILLLASLLTSSSFMGGQFFPLADQAEIRPGANSEIPVLSFCEILEQPQLHFDKTVRLSATYRVGYETAYLIDDQCVLSHSVKIGVGFLNTGEKERAAIRESVDRIMSGAYGNGRARVTVVGMLRNSPDRGFRGYRYRFDIMRFEDISREDASQTIIVYEGTLQAGGIYRAMVRGDRDFGLSLVPSLRVALHHAVRLEWTNLYEFRALRQLRQGSRLRQIVFVVGSDEIKRVAERRWNRTLRCKIILAE